MIHLFLKLDFCLFEIKTSSKLKNKTIFQTSSSSWLQKCKKIWKKFILWRNSAKKTFTKSHNLSFFLFKKKLLDVHMIVHKCQKNSSIHIENSFYQSSYFEAQKRTLLAFAGWCHKYHLTFMHKTLILDRWRHSAQFRLAFWFYTVKSHSFRQISWFC